MILQIMKIDSLEPTNRELLEVMQKAFVYVEDRFDLVEARMDQRFGVVDARLDTIEIRLDSIEVRLAVVERDLGKVKVSLEDIQEDVTTLAAAFDRDSVTLINHGQRIKNLEELAIVA